MEEVKETASIIHPFKDIHFDGEITDEIINLVREWSRVRNSIESSVGRYVRDSLRCSVWDPIWGSVRDTIWDSVGFSIWGSVSDSLGYSTEYNIRRSMRDVVYAYISSFFDTEYAYDLSPAIKLWKMGLVPSFDGTTWRLNNYKGIVWEDKNLFKKQP